MGISPGLSTRFGNLVAPFGGPAQYSSPAPPGTAKKARSCIPEKRRSAYVQMGGGRRFIGRNV